MENESEKLTTLYSVFNYRNSIGSRHSTPTRHVLHVRTISNKCPGYDLQRLIRYFLAVFFAYRRDLLCAMHERACPPFGTLMSCAVT